MAKVIMGIGIPGSGKTTILKKIVDDYNYSYICPDDIRLELTGDTNDQSKNKEVWEESYRLLEKYLKEGKTVVFDATFADAHGREDCISLAHKFGANKVQGIYIDLPIEIAKDRNSNRERVVPEHIIESMHKSLKLNSPELQEGFDSIFTLDEYCQAIKTELKVAEGNKKREFKTRIK